MNNIKNRLKGSLYGFAIGDAMGATTEFMSEDKIKSEYGKLTDIVGDYEIGRASCRERV